MNLKSAASTVAAIAMCHMALADNLSFRSSPLLAGRASLTEDGFRLSRSLGAANFTPELSYPYASSFVPYIVDEEAKFYNSSQRTIDLKKRPVCNTPKMAAKMAETVFVNVYGEKVLAERPWHVTDMGDSYAVTGSLEEGFLGGVAQLKIMKENGAVILYLHGK